MNHLIQLGRETFEFGSRGVKRLKRRLLAKRNQVAQVQGAKSYKHAKELDAYGVMDDYIPVRGQSGLESAAEIQQKLRRKKMEGMQRRRRKQKTAGNVKYEKQSFEDAMEDVRKAKESRKAFTAENSRPRKRGRGYGMTTTEKAAAGLGITGVGTGIYYYKRQKNKNQ